MDGDLEKLKQINQELKTKLAEIDIREGKITQKKDEKVLIKETSKNDTSTEKTRLHEQEGNSLIYLISGIFILIKDNIGTIFQAIILLVVLYPIIYLVFNIIDSLFPALQPVTGVIGNIIFFIPNLLFSGGDSYEYCSEDRFGNPICP